MFIRRERGCGRVSEFYSSARKHPRERMVNFYVFDVGTSAFNRLILGRDIFNDPR